MVKDPTLIRGVFDLIIRSCRIHREASENSAGFRMIHCDRLKAL
jgi:hypothetical protein